MHFNVDVMAAVLRFKFLEMWYSFQHMYRILTKRFWISRTDLDFIQNKLYKDLCLKITPLEFGTQINIYNNISWKNAVEIGLTNEESSLIQESWQINEACWQTIRPQSPLQTRAESPSVESSWWEVVFSRTLWWIPTGFLYEKAFSSTNPKLLLSSIVMRKHWL